MEERVDHVIPEEAFTEILAELKRRPLAVNKYRKKVGEGRSQAFGIVGKRSLAPDYSRQCWLRPALYHHLLTFGNKYVDISFNAITVNDNYSAGKHYDKHNLGPSYLVAFGTYTGGELLVHESDLSGSHDVCRKPMTTDFSKILHSVAPFQGNRYSLVYYWYHTKKSVAVPAPSVRYEEGEYCFYRGSVKITKKDGLPHPLKNRVKKKMEFIREDKDVSVSFE